MKQAKLGGMDIEDAPEPVPACPACGKPGLRIVYGRLTFEGRRQAQRGDFIAGGCMLSEVSPRFGCLSCRHTWGSMGDKLRALSEELKARKGSSS